MGHGEVKHTTPASVATQLYNKLYNQLYTAVESGSSTWVDKHTGGGFQLYRLQGFSLQCCRVFLYTAVEFGSDEDITCYVPTPALRWTR